MVSKKPFLYTYINVSSFSSYPDSLRESEVYCGFRLLSSYLYADSTSLSYRGTTDCIAIIYSQYLELTCKDLW